MAWTLGALWKRASGSIKTPQNEVIVSGPGVTMVDTNTAQTLTNKTITSPVMTGGTLTNASLVTPTVTNATFANSISTITVATLAGLGTVIANAAPIVSTAPALIYATGGNNSVGIQLPVAITGARYTIKNDQTANGIMKVYPAVNATINGLTANTAISMAANTIADFFAVNTTGWVTLPLLPS